MQKRFPVTLGLVALVGITAFSTPSCRDDTTVLPCAATMVTIAGMVIGEDTGMPTSGIRVSLLGTDFSNHVPTGTSGAYEFQVPKGSRLVLMTDDFDASQDDYVPLIHVDLPSVVANNNMLDVLTPILPWSRCGFDTSGIVALWDDYLQNGDQNNGEVFVPTSTAASAGAIAIFFYNCDNGRDGPVDGMSYTTNTPEFPIGYMNADKVYGPNWSEYLLCRNGPDIFHPPSRTTTDWAGMALSWGDPAFTRSTVEITITDTDAQRALAFQSPFEVPVRPGALTAVFVTAIDGLPNKTVKEWFTCMGWR
ncbi:MAG: hypothetical protein V3V49_01825 [Candidatus Krumholzibacteria bacterium]